MTETKSKKEILIFVCIVMFLDALGFGLIIPIMPALIGELSIISNSEAATIAGYLLFTFAGMQFIFAPLLGGLSDRFGRRPILLLALFGFAIDYFVMAAAPTLLWLFIARMISGLCGATFAAANAAIVDISSKEDRAKVFGLTGAAVGLGFVFGPFIGGALGEIGTRLPFIAAGILTIGALIYGLIFFPETLQPENRRAFSWKRANPVGSLLAVSRFPIVLIILMAVFCIQLANQSYSSIWSFYVIEITGWSELWIGISVGFVYFSVIVGVFSFLVLAFATTGWHIYLGISIGALSGFAFPAMQAMMTNRTPEDSQGELQGAVMSLYSIAAIISPLVMAKIFTAWTDETGPYLAGAPFILATGLIVVSFLVFSYGVRRIAKSAAISAPNPPPA